MYYQNVDSSTLLTFCPPALEGMSFIWYLQTVPVPTNLQCDWYLTPIRKCSTVLSIFPTHVFFKEYWKMRAAGSSRIPEPGYHSYLSHSWDIGKEDISTKEILHLTEKKIESLFQEWPKFLITLFEHLFMWSHVLDVSVCDRVNTLILSRTNIHRKAGRSVIKWFVLYHSISIHS